jgi:hypothetical protein
MVFITINAVHVSGLRPSSGAQNFIHSIEPDAVYTVLELLMMGGGPA